MRIVKHYINEKFEEISDPIQDLGIGMSAKKMLGKIQHLQQNPGIGSIDFNYINNSYILQIWDYSGNHKNQVIDLVTDTLGEQFFELIGGRLWGVRKILCTAIIKPEYVKLFKNVFRLKAGALEEKFLETSDPIDDMKIGLKHKYLEFIRKMHLELSIAPLQAALGHAAFLGEFDVAKYILESGVHPDINGAYAMKKAILSGDLDMIKLLVSYGSNIKFNGSLFLQETLVRCWNIDPSKKTIEIFEYFLQLGATPPFSYMYSDPSAISYIFYDLIKKYTGINALEESLNEKFSEEGDPIRDMGIGITRNMIVKKLSKLDEIVNVAGITYHSENGASHLQIIYYWEMYINEIVEFVNTIIGEQFFNLVDIRRSTASNVTCYAFIKPEYDEFFKSCFVTMSGKSHLLTEKFSEEGDPVRDMGIGLRNVINKYIKEHDPYETVKRGLDTPVMFIADSSIEDETKKEWIEFLLREGNEDLTKWGEEHVEKMVEIGVQFIPNSKVLPDVNLSYKIKNGNYYLYASDWTDFIQYINVKGDVDEEFIRNLLDGDSNKYFDYHGDIDLSDIVSSLSQIQVQQLFDFLKPLCVERFKEANEAKDLSELFDIINDELYGMKMSLLNAYANNIANVEEIAAYNEVVGTIKRQLFISDTNYKADGFVFKTTQEGIEKLFTKYISYDSDAKGIEYRPPPHGWGGDFDYEFFIDEFENLLE